MKTLSLMFDSTTVAGLIAAIIVLLTGCTHTGNVVRFEQRSVAGITSITFGEYVLPVVSISSGPSLNVWQTKDADCEIWMKGGACTTNETSALGIYNSKEQKTLHFEGTFNVQTNKVEAK